MESGLAVLCFNCEARAKNVVCPHALSRAGSVDGVFTRHCALFTPAGVQRHRGFAFKASAPLWPDINRTVYSGSALRGSCPDSVVCWIERFIGFAAGTCTGSYALRECLYWLSRAYRHTFIPDSPMSRKKKNKIKKNGYIQLCGVRIYGVSS